MAKLQAGSSRFANFKATLGPSWAWGFPLAALFIKFITIANIPGYIWLGADGESYLDGVNGLIEGGLASDREKLQYFPAGYPIIIWIFAKVSLSNTLLILSIFQSVIFAFATWLFARTVNSNRLAKYGPWISFLISFNPTLALSSMAIGYESLTASLILLSVTLILKITKEEKKTYLKIIGFSFINAIMAFIQPRYLATTLVITFVWFFMEFKKAQAIKYISIVIIILMLAPISLAFRNQQATGKFFVSNNLGVTMNVGAGPESTGGYTNKATGVKCDPEPKTDNQRVMCVLKWYATNPTETLRLSFNKTLYFFSPWSGPLANGTMARNPWLKVNPVSQIAKTPDGWRTVYGGFGKLVSWLWFLGQIGLMAWGAIWLWRQGQELKLLSIISISTIGTSWLIALGTIGDHRFRLPVMGLILLLQVAGLRGLSRKPLILKATAKRR